VAGFLPGHFQVDVICAVLLLSAKEPVSGWLRV
jgi:hypothetical protein